MSEDQYDIHKMAQTNEIRQKVHSYFLQKLDSYADAFALVGNGYASESLLPEVTSNIASHIREGRDAMGRDKERWADDQNAPIELYDQFSSLFEVGAIVFDAIGETPFDHQVDTHKMSGDEMRVLAMFKDWKQSVDAIISDLIEDSRSLIDHPDVPDEVKGLLTSLMEFHDQLGQIEDGKE